LRKLVSREQEPVERIGLDSCIGFRHPRDLEEQQLPILLKALLRTRHKRLKAFPKLRFETITTIPLVHRVVEGGVNPSLQCCLVSDKHPADATVCLHHFQTHW
jgi:hypothetical protein